LLATASLLPVTLGGASAIAAESDFNGFLAGVRRDAIARGVRPATVDVAFEYVQYLPHVVELDHRQPEHKMTFGEYLAKVVTQKRLDDARHHLVDNWQLLERVQQQYNVQPRFIVALWGVESNFGRTMGSYSVPAALATLAYEGRRGAMFRAELISALKILDQGHVRVDHMLGSWAGAMGQCQFMPSTFLSYAVDFDRDGRRDIWNDRRDVLGSIGHYVSRLGWRGDESWGREVVVPQNIDSRYTGLDTRRSVHEWARLGIRPAGGGAFSGHEPEASLVLPDGAGGTALLVYNNFRAIMRWNKSTYFAAAVGYIADSMARG
jgi:membrane-bound lytic murein transglycosylase B